MTRSKILVAVGAWVVAGCAGDSHGRQVSDARMQQAEDRASARKTVVEERADTQEESAAKVYDERDKRIEASGQPGETASQDLNELSEERTTYQRDAREKLDKNAIRIQEAQQKITVLGSRASTSVQGELKTVQTEHALVKQKLADLEAAPSSQWESEKSRVEQHMDDLDSRLSDLDDHIDEQ